MKHRRPADRPEQQEADFRQPPGRTGRRQDDRVFYSRQDNPAGDADISRTGSRDNSQAYSQPQTRAASRRGSQRSGRMAASRTYGSTADGNHTARTSAGPDYPAYQHDQAPDEAIRRKTRERLAQIERRKARSRAFSLTVLVLAIMVLTVFAIVMVMRQARPRPRFLFIQPGAITHTVQANGLIIRDEQLFAAPSDGLLKPLSSEGSRAARGQKLALVIPPGMESDLKTLQKYERDIIELQNELMQQGKGSGARAIYAESASSLSSVINLLRQDMTRQDLSNITAYESALSILLEQRTTRLMSVDFHDARLASLKQDHQALEQTLGLVSGTLVCQKPGVVSYKLDGLEHELTNSTILTMGADRIRQLLDQAQAVTAMSSEVVKDQPVLRITTSLYQSLAFYLPDVPISAFPMDSQHTLTLVEDGLVAESCQVVRSEKQSDGLLVVFRTDRRVEWLSDRRMVKAGLVLSRTEGLKVPYSALIDHDPERGQASLMIVVGGYTRICLVDVTDHDQESAIISPVEGETYQPAISTILVVNPDAIEAGEFIGN